MDPLNEYLDTEVIWWEIPNLACSHAKTSDNPGWRHCSASQTDNIHDDSTKVADPRQILASLAPNAQV